LSDPAAFAFWAMLFVLFMFRDRLSQAERLAAFLAEKFVGGHCFPPFVGEPLQLVSMFLLCQ
jgi:hypothetical protein